MILDRASQWFGPWFLQHLPMMVRFKTIYISVLKWDCLGWFFGYFLKASWPLPMALRAPDFRWTCPIRILCLHDAPPFTRAETSPCDVSSSNLNEDWWVVPALWKYSSQMEIIGHLSRRGSKTPATQTITAQSSVENSIMDFIQRLIMSIKWSNHAPVLVVQCNTGVI